MHAKEYMKKLLVVTGSVREGRAADNVLRFITDQLAQNSDYEVKIADFKALPLPFLDTAVTPSSDGYKATNENVVLWTKMVADADGIVFVTPEYNYSMTAVLKNAIDWIYKEWAGKPVTFVGYGWAGGAKAIAALRIVMASTIAARATENEVNLHFVKEVDLNGNVNDLDSNKESFEIAMQELSALIDTPVTEPKAV